jgi:hypothetical protein
MSRLVRAARISRPLFLMLAGVLVGATLVAPVSARVTGSGAEPAVTTYTRSASCAGLSFYPADTGTTYANAGTLRIRTDGSAGGYFRCDPGLPHGAVVTRVRFTLEDGSSSGEAGPCSLRRSGLTTASASTYDVLASVSSTGVSAFPGTVRYADTTISNATINNGSYAYWLECWLTGWGGGPYFGLYGADISYTITATKG